MATKTISLMDDAYDLLVRNKQRGESFSQIVRRMVDKQRDIMQFAGAWRDVDTERIKKGLASLRAKSTKDVLHDLRGL